MSDSAQRDSEQAAKLARLALAAGVAYLLFQTFSPFFTAIAWAAVLSYSLHPMQVRLTRLLKGRRTASALLMCVIVTLVVILPLLYFSVVLGGELAKTYKTVSALVEEGGSLQAGLSDSPVLSLMRDQLREYERLTGTNVKAMVAGNVKEIGTWVLSEGTVVAQNVVIGLFQIILMMVCIFYFLQEGERVVGWIENALPLTQRQQRIVFQRFDEVVTASVEGNTIVALLEGTVGGLAFLVAGLPTPALWGAIMGLLAYVPAIGASLVWVPGAAYLWFIGAYGKMAVVCIAGGIIALLDQVLRTILVGDRSKLHPLLVFFSVLGGIRVFGILGIVAGPLIVAIGRTMLDIYRLEQTGTLESPPAAKR
ncbi:MAG TPA: AI-2E family transporter [Nitrospiraceae bacterium]|jgi:predicted PurR-regulated permease PerM